MSKSLRVAAVDLNGQLRGKRVPKGMSRQANAHAAVRPQY